jgi:seryl-tRNA synthetase
LEMEAPFLVNSATAFGTGQLPDKDAQMYYVPLDELYLIPTAEVPLTNYYREEVLQASPAAYQTLWVFPLLSAGGGLLRQRCPRSKPPPPV